MASEIESLDLNLLLNFQSILSLITLIGVAPVYNLPLFLFGLISINSTDSNSSTSSSSSSDSIRFFSLLLAISTLLDFFWLLSSWRAETHTLLLMLIILNFTLKPITLLASLGNLRSRGEPTIDFGNIPNQFNFGGFGGIGIGNSNSGNRFSSAGNQTVWQAPGGYPEHAGEEEEERIGTSNRPSVPQNNSQRSNPPASNPIHSAGVAEGGGYHTLE